VTRVNKSFNRRQLLKTVYHKYHSEAAGDPGLSVRLSVRTSYSKFSSYGGAVFVVIWCYKTGLFFRSEVLRCCIHLPHYVVPPSEELLLPAKYQKNAA